MKHLLLAISLVLSMTQTAMSDDDLPPPFFGESAGGHFCETEQQMLDFLALKDLMALGELEPVKGFPPGCGETVKGEQTYVEPMRWVAFKSATVLLARVTTRENVVYYVYLGVRINEEL